MRTFTNKQLALMGAGAAGVLLLLYKVAKAGPSGPQAMSQGDPCYPDPKWMPATCDSGPRMAQGIRWIVLHSTEGDTIDGAVGTFRAPGAPGSTQVVAGDTGCVRMLSDLTIPCGAQGANVQGLHIELTGHAAWTREQWLAHMATLVCAAKVVADWCVTYGIPAVYLDAAALKDPSSRGITTHVTVNEAFKYGSHWDPGPNFPMDVFLSLVNGT